jgi:hypothetical protein
MGGVGGLEVLGPFLQEIVMLQYRQLNLGTRQPVRIPQQQPARQQPQEPPPEDSTPDPDPA